jgi:hypothetical protein
VLIPELLLSGIFLPVNKIQTLIPITVEQLLEGKMFAQPEAKAKVKQMTNPPAPAAAPSSQPAGPSSAAPGETTPAAAPSSAPAAPSAGPVAAAVPDTTAAEATAREGEAAHQVVGAMAPSPQVEKIFHKYTPQPVAGMPVFVRWLSMLAVSRWGMEALADLCLHGHHSTQDYAYKIINTVYISMHPDDIGKLESGLEAPAEAFVSGGFPLPSNFWKDKGPYIGVLAVHILVMTLTVLLLMKRKDVH